MQLMKILKVLKCLRSIYMANFEAASDEDENDEDKKA